MMNNISINTEFIKLDQFLKLSGEVISGGEAKLIISAGKVKVNGEACTMRGKKIKNGDIVEINNNSYMISNIK